MPSLPKKDSKFLLKIENSIAKLKQHFPTDPRGDFTIKYKNKQFVLQKAHLRLFSSFFARVCQSLQSQVTIVGDYDQTNFQNILSLLYGNEIEMDRHQIGSFYQITEALELTSLLATMKKDITQNIGQYSIFILMDLAQSCSDQELFDICVEQLYKESFSQINFQQHDLLNLKLLIFKLVIKMHNKFKINTKTGIQYGQIDAITRRYCDHNQLHPDMYHSLKFELIDLNSLTSKEYKEIFLNHVENAFLKSASHDSSADSDIDINQEMKLTMQNTFEKKRNKELTEQNRCLGEELKQMRGQSSRNKDIYQQMEEELKNLKIELKKKEEQNIQQKKIISKYETVLTYMQNQLQRKSTEIDLLATKFHKMKKAVVSQPTTVSIQNNFNVQSQYLPSHMFGQIMKGTNKEAKKSDVGGWYGKEEEVEMVI